MFSKMFSGLSVNQHLYRKHLRKHVKHSRKQYRTYVNTRAYCALTYNDDKTKQHKCSVGLNSYARFASNKVVVR